MIHHGVRCRDTLNDDCIGSIVQTDPGGAVFTRMSRETVTQRRPSRGNLVASLIAMALTTLLSSGAERKIAWRIASQVSTVVSLAAAFMVIFVKPVGWLRGIVGGAFALSLFSSRRFVVKAASGKPKTGFLQKITPFRQDSTRRERGIRSMSVNLV
jgi:hypothetical protein